MAAQGEAVEAAEAAEAAATQAAAEGAEAPPPLVVGGLQIDVSFVEAARARLEA